MHLGVEKLPTENIINYLSNMTICQKIKLSWLAGRAYCDVRAMRKELYENQSNVVKVDCHDTHENVSFSAKEMCYKNGYMGGMESTRQMRDLNDATLGKFLSRPIKIGTYTWNVGSTFYQTLSPWSSFITNARVSNRLSNFNLMRAKLMIKVVVNGNSFHYGRAVASYEPLAAYNEIVVNPPTATEWLITETQRPKIFLNPTMSTGGEIECPFFWPQDYGSIPDGDLEQMGLLRIRSFDTLEHANGATDPVSISVFAWMENVELTMLTSSDAYALSPQSETLEANKEGIVSGPATNIAKVASKLTNVPYIGQYALATAGAAKGIAGVAKLFGYSRPALTKDNEPYKPVGFSSMALTTVPDGASKLTVDDKQELTIDPKIAGLDGPDPLAISSIATKESYFTQFVWSQGAAPGAFLFSNRVDPCLYGEVLAAPSNKILLPAVAATSLPFKYWTGTLKFRFQFVCSAYHRGRVRIVYDPNTYSAETEYNVNYTHILDLAEQQDFTVEIGPSQPRTFMEHAIPGVTTINDLYRTTSTLPKQTYGNGTLSVYVLNELTTPNSTVTNDIRVNVFVQAGEDFEVSVPSDSIANYKFAPQSGEVSPTAINNQGLDSPEQNEDIVELADPGAYNDHLNVVYNGEAIRSFRTLLKRYNYHSVLAQPSTTTTLTVSNIRRSAFPYYRGEIPEAVDNTTTVPITPYNYCNTVMLHWVTQMFAGYRGSIRWKVLLSGGSANTDAYVNVQRGGPSNYLYRVANLPLVYATLEEQRRQAVAFSPAGLDDFQGGFGLTGLRGQVVAGGKVNPYVEFEVPYYDNRRFIPGKRLVYTNQEGSLNLDKYNVWDIPGS